MASYRSSFWKTTLAAGCLGLAGVFAGHAAARWALETGFDRWASASVWTGWLVGIAALLVALGGAVALYRDALQGSDREDLYLRLNRSRSEAALAQWPRRVRTIFSWRRLVGAGQPIVGDLVQIRSLPEIESTLDACGTLDRLPFLPEMARFCGQTARVFRCVDKIYDYGRTKTLKRIDDTFLLTGLRCDGSAHDDCQAGCYLMWKKAWLRPVDERAAVGTLGGADSGAVRKGMEREIDLQIVGGTLTARPRGAARSSSSNRYVCQYTELAAASRPMKSWDFRQDLRPLLTGNVALAAFCIAMLTRLFNRAQRARGGSGVPHMPGSKCTRTPLVLHGLAPADSVLVKSAEDISATLNDRGRNRGLWFDADMLKHVGKPRRVLRRVDKIIDDATGQMLEMKAPCIVLEGVYGSGEHLRFCSQHDYIFWREAWLVPQPGRRQATKPEL